MGCIGVRADKVCGWSMRIGCVDGGVRWIVWVRCADEVCELIAWMGRADEVCG